MVVKLGAVPTTFQTYEMNSNSFQTYLAAKRASGAYRVVIKLVVARGDVVTLDVCGGDQFFNLFCQSGTL